MLVQVRLQTVVNAGGISDEIQYLCIRDDPVAPALRTDTLHHQQGILYLFYIVTIILHALQ